MIRNITDHLQKHRAYDVGLLVLIGLAATSNWFNLGLPKGHDAVADMLSAQAAYNSIFLHHMLPGWTNDWFLGYPQFHVFPPVSSFMVLVSSFLFGWVLGTKLLFLSFFILSGVFAYFYMSELTRNRYASLVAGLAYMFLPYHIIDVGFEGHQGSFGPAYMLVPLVLLCLERSIKKPSIKYVLANGVLLALLTLTFPQVLPLLVGPFLVLYVILRIWWERHGGTAHVNRIAVTSVAALCLSFILTAFWWLPLISEIRYSYATSFPLQAASDYSATWRQALTLRPLLDCAHSSAWGATASAFLKTIRFLPFILVLLGIILKLKNKYVWFFSASVLAAVLLAMGPDSSIDVFGVAYRYVPFFNRVRTPVRFLLFGSLAYAVLIGFCVHGISEQLGHMHAGNLRRLRIPLLVTLLVSLLIVGNTWQETRTAFSTIELPTDQKNAIAQIKDAEDGDYRIADPPFDTYTYYAETNNIIRPIFWTYLHGKETVFGAGTSVAVKYTADVLESLNTNLERGPFDMSQWLSIFNVKYVLIDKTNPLSTNVILDENFDRIWTSDTVDIYENHNMMPRVFAVSMTNERPVDLWSGDNITVSGTDSTTDSTLSLDTEHARSHDRTLKASYSTIEPGPDSTSLAASVEGIDFSPDDAIHLAFYSDKAVPDISLNLDLVEQDGSRYGVELYRADGIEAGWNEINFPISLLALTNSTDENNQLDLDQIQTLEFGPVGQRTSEKSHEVSLYFDAVSVVTQEINTSVEYTKIRPGKYEVHVDLASPAYLVLSESYHPYWVAHVTGSDIHPQIMYECLNSFYLEPGEHDVTLDFTTSPPRIAGNVISVTAALLVCSAGVSLLIRERRKRRRQPEPLSHVEDPEQPLR
jgi:hypothetical protein